MAVYITVGNLPGIHKMVKDYSWAKLGIISTGLLKMLKRRMEQEDKDVTMETTLDNGKMVNTMDRAN